MHRALLTMVVLLLIGSCGGTPEQISGDPDPGPMSPAPSIGAEAAGLAIDGFTPEDDLNASFGRIHDLARDNPVLLRDAALGRLESGDPRVRFAAVYALSLTAAEGPSAEALIELLAADRVNERVLAAAGLIPLGRREALPVLIAALSDQTLLDYRDPPKPAWEFARALLLDFTQQDLGLVAAATPDEVAAVKSDWEAWWDANGSSVSWRATDRRFVEGSE